MLYWITDYLYDWLDTHGMGFFRLFLNSEFRAVAAIVLSFALVVTLGPRTIRFLLRLKVGDNPEFYHKDLNQLMKGKANTPTMGGILIAGAILACTVLLADIVANFYVQMALICLVWLGAVGFADDYFKLTSARRKPGSREGLYTWEKLLFQFGIATLLGLFIHHYGYNKIYEGYDYFKEMSHALTLPILKSWKEDPVTGNWIPANLIVLPTLAFVILTIVVIAGSSNAVNLTDGMDGLVSGIMPIVAFAIGVLAWIAGQQDKAQTLLVPYIPLCDELSVVAGAMVGACLGFLWFNCSPAQVFMGDTGSLPLGGLIGYIAVVIRQEFLLLIIGGIFVFEALSVILQVGYFKATGGKRIFRCAPIHHHFHLAGWTEQQVVVRFWLITAILAAAALATIKVR